MVEQNVGPERTQIEPPLYGGLFILLMVLLALTSFGLHVGLLALIYQRASSDGPTTVTATKTAFGIPLSTTILPGSSVVWNGELWVSVVTGGQPMVGSLPVRAQSSRLVAFDIQTGRYRETNLKISPAPLGILVVDGKLWAVSETSVDYVQDGQVISRRPIRGLNEPTKPFIYDGQLAIIDKNRNDVYTLLTWNEDEWTEVGNVEAPVSANSSPWYKPELRVLSDGSSVHLFFSDAQTICYREGIGLVDASDPVSALTPANSDPVPQLVATRFGMTPLTLSPGWKRLPITINWGDVWDVAIINGELFAFSGASSNGNSVIQQYKKQGNAWLNTTPKSRTETASFSVASGSPGYLVTSNMRLFAFDGIKDLEQMTIGIKMTEKLQFALGVLAFFTPYLISTCVLGFGTWWLMRIHRTPQYLYGKQTVVLASILRRGIARGIDSLALVFPPVFWFFVAVGANSNVQQQYSAMGFENPMLIVLCSIFGMWLGAIVILSYMEGNWGITPGKWLCGIRTLRTTLRPCGMLRALARELLIYGDGLLFATWLPGVMLIAFTRNWQRAGDLTADTVVVLTPKRIPPLPN